MVFVEQKKERLNFTEAKLKDVEFRHGMEAATRLQKRWRLGKTTSWSGSHSGSGSGCIGSCSGSKPRNDSRLEIWLASRGSVLLKVG